MEKIAIRKKYIDYVLDKGEKPKSVHAFAKTLKMNESDFYNFYASFEAIEKDVWKSLFVETLEQLEADETYLTYAAKDKLLAFYYLWISKLRENRSYILTFRNENLRSIPMNAKGLDEFKNLFIKYAEQLVNEGIDAKEITERKFISDKYTYGFWLQTMFVLNYWVNDSSDNFEMTDAAVEKAVNLCFKLIGDSALDSVIDFGKFMLQKAM